MAFKPLQYDFYNVIASMTVQVEPKKHRRSQGNLPGNLNLSKSRHHASPDNKHGQQGYLHSASGNSGTPPGKLQDSSEASVGNGSGGRESNSHLPLLSNHTSSRSKHSNESNLHTTKSTCNCKRCNKATLQGSSDQQSTLTDSQTIPAQNNLVRYTSQGTLSNDHSVQKATNNHGNNRLGNHNIDTSRSDELPADDLPEGVLTRQMTWDCLPTPRTLQPVSKKWLFKGVVKKHSKNTGSAPDGSVEKMKQQKPRELPTEETDPSTNALALLRTEKNTSVDFLNLRSYLRRQASIPVTQRSDITVPWASLAPEDELPSGVVIREDSGESRQNPVSFRLTLGVDSN